MAAIATIGKESYTSLFGPGLPGVPPPRVAPPHPVAGLILRKRLLPKGLAKRLPGGRSLIPAVGARRAGGNGAAGEPVFSNSAVLLPALGKGQLGEFSRRQMLYF